MQIMYFDLVRILIALIFINLSNLANKIHTFFWENSIIYIAYFFHSPH